MKKIELKTPYLWLLFLLWVAWGQLVAYGVLNGLVPDFILGIADAIGSVVPSITRLGDNYPFGLAAARRIAAIAIAMTPLLFLLLLLADVKETVNRARKTGGQAKAVMIIVAVSLSVFISGFGGKTPGFPGRLFYTNDIAFSFLVSLMTYLSTCFFRLAWGLGFNR